MLTIHIPDANPEDHALEAEVRREVALLMYQRQIWSMGQAARYAGMPYVLFQRFLGERGISLNYSESSFWADVEAIKKFRL